MTLTSFLERIGQLEKAAEDEVNALCHGKQFRMSIPVQSTDSDIVIVEPLHLIPKLRAIVEMQRKALEFYADGGHVDMRDFFTIEFGTKARDCIKACDELVKL